MRLRRKTSYVMRNLLEFLTRFGTFFIFILLEALSFFLIVRFDDDKNRSFLSSASAIAGYTLKQYDAIVDFFNAPREMALLQQENKQLREQLSSAYYSFSAPVDTVVEWVRRPDSVYSKAIRQDSLALRDTSLRQVYTFIPANIISSTVTLRHNTLTIDKGSLQGVAPRMGVIGPTGVVGVVRSVSEHYAAVLSVLHADVAISASIKGKGYFGSLVWRGSNPRLMYLDAVPNHSEIVKGDTVVTSGFSGVFPAGILVGVVEYAKRNPSTNFQDIQVRLAADLSKVGHVYVVQHQWREELNQLDKQVKSR